MSKNRNSHLAESADGLGTRYVVAFKQIPGNPSQALVIKMDTIVSAVDKDALVALVWTPGAQHQKDFINVLHDNNLLKHYQQKGYFTAVDIDEVIMTPGDGAKFPLRQVLDAINKQNGIAPVPTADAMAHIIDRNPMADRLREEVTGTQTNASIARSIMLQAKMLQDDVNRKLEEAYNLDPTLRPGRSHPVVVSAVAKAPVPTKAPAKTTKPAKKAPAKKAVKK